MVLSPVVYINGGRIFENVNISRLLSSFKDNIIYSKNQCVAYDY